MGPDYKEIKYFKLPVGLLYKKKKKKPKILFLPFKSLLPESLSVTQPLKSNVFMNSLKPQGPTQKPMLGGACAL